MNKLEYGDFYKFIASMGVGLIVAGVALPYLAISSLPGILSTSQYQDLSPNVQRIVDSRNALLLLLHSLLPFISGGLILAGAISGGAGLYMWWRRQKVRDATEDWTLAKVRTEFRRQSEGERAASALAEAVEASRVDHAPIPQQPDTQPPEIPIGTVKHYLELQDRITECIARQFPDHEVESSVRMASDEFDIIARRQGRPDVVIDVKPMRGVELSFRIQRAIERHVERTTAYQKAMRRPAIGVLLFVVEDESQSGAIRQAVGSYVELTRPSLRIVTLSADQIDTFDFRPVFG